MRRLLLIVMTLVVTLMACTIEPPLKLASVNEGFMTIGKVTTELKVIWGVDAEWLDDWWYGWDAQDIDRWGELAYPEPESYEARLYYFGEGPGESWSKIGRRTLYETEWFHNFDFGYHDMLIWSNISSKDGTQVVIINENDPDNIVATTSRARLNYQPPRVIGSDVLNHPEIFYANQMERLYISRDKEDYDYFDSQRNAWVKEVKTELYPLVYIYLVQVVIYNNHNRIVGMGDNCAISSLADGVSIHTGRTSEMPVVVTYPMRLKKGLTARGGLPADIFGGKLTTFGLCGMEPWAKSRGPQYAGTRGDLSNTLAIKLSFSNASDSVYTYDVTRQMQAQAHGGIVTIEIDADTIHIPSSGGGVSNGFDPYIAPSDSVTHEFEM